MRSSIGRCASLVMLVGSLSLGVLRSAHAELPWTAFADATLLKPNWLYYLLNEQGGVVVVDFETSDHYVEVDAYEDWECFAQWIMKLSNLNSLGGEDPIDHDIGGQNIRFDMDGHWERRAQGTGGGPPGSLKGSRSLGEGSYQAYARSKITATKLPESTPPKTRGHDYEIWKGFFVAVG